MKIPPIDLSIYNKKFEERIIRRISENIVRNTFILGPEVSELEEKFKKKYGVKHAIAVNSGTDALLLSLDAYDIGKNDEVIVPAFTFIATVDVVIRLGAKPVFVDINCDTFNMNVEEIEKKLTPKTKAIIPVHLYGLPANMDKIMQIARKYDLIVVEDCAQAQDAKFNDKYVGTIGHIGAFSFYPTKNLGGMGDGGIILTNDDSVADKIKKMRDHGRSEGYDFPLIGYNSRLGVFQAAALNVKFDDLDNFIKEKRNLAEYYIENLKDIEEIKLPLEPQNCRHTYNLFTIKTKKRNELKRFLSQQGIGTMIYYPKPLHLQKCLQFLEYKKGDFPVSEKVADEVLSLPLYFGLQKEKQKYIIENIRKFFEK